MTMASPDSSDQSFQTQLKGSVLFAPADTTSSAISTARRTTDDLPGLALTILYDDVDDPV